MKAEEARKLSSQNSKRMKKIYETIEKSAKQGNRECILHTGEASDPEVEILRANGYEAGFEYSKTDGGQYILVKW